MAWKVKYLPATEVIAVNAAGEISNEDLGAQVGEVIGLLRAHQATLVLADCSEALSEVSLPTLYGLPDFFTQCGGLWNVRVAVVLPRSRYRVEAYQFFKLVCSNAGYNVRLFDEREAAAEWLEQTRLGRKEAESRCEASASVLARTPCG